jgi:hypothetical protein
MIKFVFNIETNIKDTIGYPSALSVCGRAFADHISSMLTDIKDPKTGASPSIESEVVERGIMLSLKGSPSCVAEAEIRILAMTKPDFISASELLAKAAQQLRDK